MIVERAVLAFLRVETFAAGVWTPWTGAATSISIVRGGRRADVGASIDVGTLTLNLLNAGDPMAGASLRPHLPIRLVYTPLNLPVYTGRIVDLSTGYVVNKSTGAERTVVTVTAADAVRTHANTTRYGAVSAGDTGFESWAQRIIRLSASSTESIAPPADDSPIPRYGI